MSNSLKDQLLALGLAPKKSKPKPGKQGKPQARKARPARKDAEISLDKAYSMRNKQERQQKEKAAEQKREQERQRREINQKIKALIKAHAIRDPEAENKRNFLYKGRIRSVLATREQLNEINAGSIGVVYLRGNYHLMPADKIEEIRQFAADHIPDLSGAEHDDEKDNPVPDDLIW